MPVTYTYPYLQYGGLWTPSQQADAKAAGTWPVPPAPKLYAWGAGSSGELGLGNRTNYSSPKQVGSLTNWSSIFGQRSSSVLIKTDGTLWVWGEGGTGRLGLGNTTSYSSPKQVGSLTNWQKVSFGVSSAGHVLAVKTDGTLWAWGRNAEGQLGLGNQVNYSSPKQIGNLTNWKEVATFYFSSIAVKTDGTLWTWGANTNGELGLGNSGAGTARSSPNQVGALTNWLSVSAGYYSCVAIKTDGTLWAWGRNNYGQLGLGNTTNYSSPKQVGSLTNWLKISSGGYFVSSVKTDGTLWTWGLNGSGQLGLGDTTNRSSPVQVGALTNWSEVSNGTYHSLSVKTDGTLWAWGANGIGQLGLGDTTYRSSPSQVGSLTSWGSFSGGGSHSLGIAIN